MEDKSRIIEVQIEDQMRQAYLDYSMSVIVSRALPDIRDGLKPSQRRIIYAMSELNLVPGGHFRKCAKIAGDTSGNYHPHGEQVVYPTLVRLAQPWNMRYPLIEGQGNFGSIDGDPPAAMRYTEARLQKVTMELLAELDKDTVNFRSNYDETRKEPEVFPARIPNLLINGSSGIAVGMATNMPPHNLTEICNAVIALIDNPDLEIWELHKYIKGPDFPMGGYILGTKGIMDYFLTGRGQLLLRGEAEIETNKNEQEQIIIRSIPYQITKTALIDKIVELVKDKRIEGISDIRDESGRDGMRLVIMVKRNADAQTVLNQLYKYTQLQTTFGVINLCLVNGVPQVVNMKDMLNNFIEFRHEVILRRTNFELRNAEERLHILEGLRIALDHLDEVIATIRASQTPPEASEQLQEKFGLSEIQAKAILDMRLQRLTGLEREKIETEYEELLKVIDHLKDLLEHKEKRMQLIKEETAEIRDKYGDPRRTQILESYNGILNPEDMIADELVVVTITHEGYVKRMPIDTYRVQGRGGRGLTAANLREEDFIQYIFVASTHSYILLFTDLGKCYWLKVYEIPEAGRTARGKAIVNLVNLQDKEKVKAFVTLKDFNPEENIVMCTKNGMVKKTPLAAFSHPRSSGILAIKLLPGDELIDARITEGNDDLILATHNGYCNRFSEREIRPTARFTQGVRGIRLREEDYVVSMAVISQDLLMENGNALTKTILAISENGYGKRTRISAYSITRRGSKGVITLKTNERNGHLAALMLVDENDDLVIITQEGMIIRQKVSDISIFERNTQGVHLINLRENDKVVDITIIPKEPDEEELDREVEKAKNAPSMQASNTMEDVTEEQDEEEEFRDEELPEEE
ncbi:MAG TPA: DNA gyrase subunit A [Candidatus Syntrophosphaera sp.]|jgi:DNA gyrase subunit A|nr:DNA gyrase subunit A [Candidatus Syntrophosphaera thermopropionivorans]HRQ99036.1 DNA gyrase subunit A [Candidatus Syntrophosphaera sp.]HON32107.1 DNA gyrase subunit A [Candidatus Syntrophosphaera thermopropionivorans]HPQ30965.1 DNA gyrase subunit A [Candidatus Syntrophosphaera thermopropionivorans]HPX63148.1 DNA gyrase subunit A [Candidatus Syntrophosphaera thermopropionivorans]